MSTPNITSPSGLPAVSTALDTIVPVSPADSSSTSMPVSAVNAARASLSGVPSAGNESYVTSVTADGAPALSSSPHAARAAAPTTSTDGRGAIITPTPGR